METTTKCAQCGTEIIVCQQDLDNGLVFYCLDCDEETDDDELLTDSPTTPLIH